MKKFSRRFFKICKGFDVRSDEFVYKKEKKRFYKTDIDTNLSKLLEMSITTGSHHSKR